MEISRLTDSEAERDANPSVAGTAGAGVAVGVDVAEIRGIRPVSRRLPPGAARTTIAVAFDYALVSEDGVL